MGDLHIYETIGMGDYLPKVSYYGSRGRIQGFLDAMNAALFSDVEIEAIDNQKKKCWLNIFNEARKLSLLDNQHNLIIKKMNWYTRKLVKLLAENHEWTNTLYWFEIEANYKEVILKISDDDNEFKIKYPTSDFDRFKNIDNYLRRDYSDKVKTYIYNLSELYNLYILGNKKEDLFYESLGYYPNVRCNIQGKKCYSPGYIDWT